MADDLFSSPCSDDGRTHMPAIYFSIHLIHLATLSKFLMVVSTSRFVCIKVRDYMLSGTVKNAINPFIVYKSIIISWICET